MKALLLLFFTSLLMVMLCSLCHEEFQEASKYNNHLYLHRNVHNFLYTCPKCDATYKKYSSYISHFRRSHFLHEKVNSGSTCNAENSALTTFQCSICLTAVCNKKDVMKHLGEHLKNGLEVECPFLNCTRSYSLATSLKSHVSRYHWSSDSVTIATINDETSFVDQSIVSESILDHDIQIQDTSCSEESLVKIRTLNIQAFILRLIGKYIIPESTVQILCEELSQVLTDCYDELFEKINTLLEENHSEPDKYLPTRILQCVMDLKGKNTENDILRSSHLRNKIFTSAETYIEAHTYVLNDLPNKNHFLHWVPLKRLLETLLQNKSVKQAMEEKLIEKKLLFKTEKVYADYMDGYAYKNIPPNTNKTLDIVLYQDGFEVCNPIGSSKKKHKLLAVYALLLNVPEKYRSKVDSVLLLMLSKEKYVKYYGYSSVLKPLIDEIRELQESGVATASEFYSVNIICMAGDNLGSNGVGGFVESFSCHNYCRFCIGSKSDILENSCASFPERTPLNYQAHLQELTEDRPIVCGIKSDSILNKLLNFHVCNALPPCLAHDLFEGVASWDSALILHKFVKHHHWLTYPGINALIDQFKYLGRDANNKPAVIPESGKGLGGQAIQNRCLLKLLPLLLISKIADYHDEYWMLLLNLHAIVEFVLAPKLTEGQLVYLESLIKHYLHERTKLFPLHNLKPKHHFLSHYPELYRKHGPLINFWTMRFESKHQYFKRCARQCKNFKNITGMLTKKHQLMKSDQFNGIYFTSTITMVPSSETLLELADNRLITELLEQINVDCTKITIAKTACISGTRYVNGQVVALPALPEDEKKFGKILHIFVYNQEIILFLCKCKCLYLPYLNIHEIMSDTDEKFVLFSNDLLDFLPLHIYQVIDRNFVVLDHGLIDLTLKDY